MRRGTGLGFFGRSQVNLVQQKLVGTLPQLFTHHPHTINIQFPNPKVERWGQLSPDESDHYGVLFVAENNHLFPPIKIINRNYMMQGIGPRVDERGNVVRGGNTAFQITETFEQYRIRITSWLNGLREQLVNNPNVTVVTLQEAPIKEHQKFMVDYINSTFPEEWWISNPMVTSDLEEANIWGVFTLINHARLGTTPPVVTTQYTQNIAIKNIQSRCRTFYMFTKEGNLVEVSNVHFPHRNPQHAFDLFMNNIVQKVIQSGIEGKPMTHCISGDWNIDAHEVHVKLKEIIQTRMQAVRSGDIPPFILEVDIFYSHDGHVKQQGTASVDMLVSIKESPAEHFGLAIRELSSEQSKAAIDYFATVGFLTIIGIAAFKDENHIPNDNEWLEPTEIYSFGLNLTT